MEAKRISVSESLKFRGGGPSSQQRLNGLTAEASLGLSCRRKAADPGSPEETRHEKLLQDEESMIQSNFSPLQGNSYIMCSVTVKINFTVA